MTQYDDPAPFDPTDPMDTLADDLRKKVAEIAIWFTEEPRYTEMSEEDRFSCFIAGAMTGVMGVVHALVHEASQDAAAEVVRIYVTSAAMNARDIRRGAN